MICADFSTFMSWLDGKPGADVDRLAAALADRTLRMAPPVLSEVLSRSRTPDLEAVFMNLIQLPIEEGFWERAGRSRACILDLGLRARLADTLIAQCCIDADVPLITRDPDFRHFAAHCGLRLA